MKCGEKNKLKKVSGEVEDSLKVDCGKRVFLFLSRPVFGHKNFFSSENVLVNKVQMLTNSNFQYLTPHQKNKKTTITK